MQNKPTAIIDDVFIDISSPDDLVELGYVASAHGIRGLVKVQTYADQSAALLKNKTWWLAAPKKPHNKSGADKLPTDQYDHDKFRGLAVQSCNSHGQNTLLVKFSDINDRNQAELLQFYTIWLPRTDFPRALTDEYYWVDLIGCEFYGLDFFGMVDQLVDNPAHALLDIVIGTKNINGEFVAKLDRKSRPIHVLVPFVAAHITTVDLQAKRIISNWPLDY